MLSLLALCVIGDICSFEIDGNPRDISALTKDTYYHISDSNLCPTGKRNNIDQQYFINFCATVKGVKDDDGVCSSKTDIGCQTWGEGKFGHTMGTLKSVKYSKLKVKGFRMEASGGDEGRKMQIDMLCPTSDRKATANPCLQSEGEDNCHACLYKFEWVVDAACPGFGGGGAGGAILITLLVVTLVYFIGGMLFMRFYKQRSGLEMVPNLAFWQELPSLIKDGFSFTVSKIKRDGGGSYSQV